MVSEPPQPWLPPATTFSPPRPPSSVVAARSRLLPPSLPPFPPSDAMRSFLERNKKKKKTVQELRLTFLCYLFAVTHRAHTFALPLPPRRPPLVILGHIFSDCEILGTLILLTILIVFLTSVGSLLISALMVGATIVAVHDPSIAREEENTPLSRSSRSTSLRTTTAPGVSSLLTVADSPPIQNPCLVTSLPAPKIPCSAARSLLTVSALPLRLSLFHHGFLFHLLGLPHPLQTCPKTTTLPSLHHLRSQFHLSLSSIPPASIAELLLVDGRRQHLGGATGICETRGSTLLSSCSPFPDRARIRSPSPRALLPSPPLLPRAVHLSGELCHSDRDVIAQPP